MVSIRSLWHLCGIVIFWHCSYQGLNVVNALTTSAYSKIQNLGCVAKHKLNSADQVLCVHHIAEYDLVVQHWLPNGTIVAHCFVSLPHGSSFCLPWWLLTHFEVSRIKVKHYVRLKVLSESKSLLSGSAMKIYTLISLAITLSIPRTTTMLSRCVFCTHRCTCC